MTARLHLSRSDDALDQPGSYASEVNCAHVIAQYLVQMPLDEMSRRANDECGMSLMKFDDSTKELRKTREVLALLNSAAKELKKIRARYGES